MRFVMGLVVLALHLTAVSASPGPEPVTEREAQPAPIVLTVENLSEALYQIAAERDALRLALRAAQDEIARSRASYEAQAGILAECNSDLASALTIGEELQASLEVYDTLLNAERKAAKRQRWITVVRFTLFGAAGGYLAAELND